jgi:hypothetical protein
VPPAAPDYLRLLERRLSALSERAREHTVTRDALGLGPADRALARRFLRPLEGSWDDGDENLVRGYLDRWLRPGQDAGVATARSLLEAADGLASMDARPPALWFLLWAMESMLESAAC